ncbi:hypothetical protein H1C71_039824 [Ictidomys tridecemlineatus]|nr:hypothetical protein H1C71_039824 [Ictidomys tridecemlineatus]
MPAEGHTGSTSMAAETLAASRAEGPRQQPCSRQAPGLPWSPGAPGVWHSAAREGAAPCGQAPLGCCSCRVGTGSVAGHTWPQPLRPAHWDGQVHLKARRVAAGTGPGAACLGLALSSASSWGVAGPLGRQEAEPAGTAARTPSHCPTCPHGGLWSFLQQTPERAGALFMPAAAQPAPAGSPGLPLHHRSRRSGASSALHRHTASAGPQTPPEQPRPSLDPQPLPGPLSGGLRQARRDACLSRSRMWPASLRPGSCPLCST